MVFSLPFVLLSGFAGFLSDRYSKQKVIFLAKAAEILVMLLGMAAFLMYGTFAAVGTWSVLFLMGTHSTFFGPGKYGVLPELFRKEDLPKANGFILMSTFLAIILGTYQPVFCSILLSKSMKPTTLMQPHCGQVLSCASGLLCLVPGQPLGSAPHRLLNHIPN